MKLKRILQLLFALILMSASLVVYTPSSFAAVDDDIVLTQQAGSNITPPRSDISENPNYSEGYSRNLFLMSANLNSSTVSGGCTIVGLSSSKVRVTGYSMCSPADPVLKVTVTLQAYYQGAWRALTSKTATAFNATRVDVDAIYNVTSGYYYRVSAKHYLFDGTSNTSRTGAIWVG